MPEAEGGAVRRKNVLWYGKPAHDWLEALPLGNGRLGAMVFGGAGTERLQINEDSIWAGGPHRNDNPEARDHLAEVRTLVFGGKWKEAQAVVDRHWLLKEPHGMPFQPAGWLEIDFQDEAPCASYRRELDIGRAMAGVSFETACGARTREYFASLAHPAIIARFESDKPGSLGFAMRWTSRMPSASRLGPEMDLILAGRGTDHEGVPGAIRYQARARVIEHDGRLKAGEAGELILEGAGYAVIAISAATNFVNYRDVSADPEERVLSRLGTLKGIPYAELRDSHLRAYRSWFDRLDIDLGSSQQSSLPTDERIRLFGNGGDADMAALYLQYGRYLLISSSQPGSQPATLQGLWNEHLDPPWDSKYTTNINIEMNYWPALNTNLLELQEPFLALIADVSQTGRETARSMYGAHGWALHHNTDIWRITGAVDAVFPQFWAVWPTCGAWFCQHLWFQYLYSGDAGRLREAWPIIRGACEFFLDFLVRKPGTPYLVACPSLSPENGHHQGVSVSDGVTMDNAMLRELFSLAHETQRILGIEDDLGKRIDDARAALPPFKVGSWGQLQEWFEDWDRPEDRHRHISHLWGLFPSNQISPRRTPVLAQAARVSLEHRGDHSTGWSTAWKMNCRARLGEGSRAWRLLLGQIRPANRETMYNEDGGSYPNLLGACAPFQIDGNFGCAAGIAELLMQSHDGELALLPALPEALPTGYARGLSARGGFIVDLSWRGGKLAEASVLSTAGGNLRLRADGALARADGAGLSPARGANPNPCFFVTPPDDSGRGQDPEGFVYDLPTQAGQRIGFRMLP